MPTTEPVQRADILQEVSDAYRCDADSLHSHHKEINFLHSPFRAFLTHTDDMKSCVTLVRDGEEQASIIIDEDASLRVKQA